MTCYYFFLNPLQDLLSSLNAVISTNERTRIITGHVIYNPAYTYKFQLKSTNINVSSISHENTAALLICLLKKDFNPLRPPWSLWFKSQFCQLVWIVAINFMAELIISLHFHTHSSLHFTWSEYQWVHYVQLSKFACRVWGYSKVENFQDLTSFLSLIISRVMEHIHKGCWHFFLIFDTHFSCQ